MTASPLLLVVASSPTLNILDTQIDVGEALGAICINKVKIVQYRTAVLWASDGYAQKVG